MTEPKRVSPEEVYQKLKAEKALLVCAYEDESKFKRVHLEGAISLSEFKSKLPSLSKDQEIVFYCAWGKEKTAAGQAAQFLEKGYPHAECLGGGVEAWKQAGYHLIDPE